MINDIFESIVYAIKENDNRILLTACMPRTEVRKT